MTNDLLKLWTRWQQIVLRPAYVFQTDLAIVKILAFQNRYKTVQVATGWPWQVIGCIHYREASFNFETFLANGDPLSNEKGQPIQTSHVPKGLGPFEDWEHAAVASILNRFPESKTWHWDIANALDNVEIWNGRGYEEIGEESPYVWAGTQFYTSGLFIKDHVFNSTSIDNRPGVAALLSRLKSKGAAFAILEVEPTQPIKT